ncbi:MAG: hypothetical protein MJ252_25115 [archaeon]|nr:hypothetical protein [archaeon]
MAEWCTIESDPGVFTELIRNIGVKGVQVEEILDLDTLEQNKEPVYGLIFLFKYVSNSGYKPNILTTYDPDLYFARQIITNACATQAILAILMNNSDKIDIGPTLTELKSFSKEMDPHMKGLSISNSEIIRQEHNKFSRPEPFEFVRTREPTEDDDVFHFIGYIHFKDKIYEIDGLQEGPILIEDNVKYEEWISKVKPAIISRIELYAGHEIKFNLLAVVENKLDKAEKLSNELNEKIAYAQRIISGEDLDMDNEKFKELNSLSKEDLGKKINEMNAILMGSKMVIEEETFKRMKYKEENARRQHNYIPFIFKMLNLMAEQGTLEGVYNDAKKVAEEKLAQEQEKEKKKNEQKK